MKTKAFLLSATLAAAALTASAQSNAVYSVNVVGYTRLTIPPGFLMIANSLNSTNNTVAVLLPDVPSGTRLFKFDPAVGNYQINTRLSSSWQTPDMTLAPGEGVFIQNTKATNLSLLFAGDVVTGLSTNSIPAGFSIKSSVLPQAGQLDTDLGFPAVSGDRVYLYHNDVNNYSIHTRASASWVGAGPPVVAVGQSFFVQKGSPANWVRDFSVGP